MLKVRQYVLSRMTDETDEVDEEMVEEAFENMTELLENMFGPGPFGDDVQTETPEGIRIAILCMKAGHALDQVADYIEDETDIDFEDPRAVNQSDLETQAVVMGVSVLADPMQRFAESVQDDDDDNPFKVSDGDDPIY